MSRRAITLRLTSGLVCALAATAVTADPCGMVPPIYQGQGPPIVRIGHQQTYVFYKDGVETFVIRPGFSGKTEEFGMLIPFPAPPAIRKVPDHIFPHIAAAVDPPEVVVDLRVYALGKGRHGFRSQRANVVDTKDELSIRKESVRVLREEAVGMYEVAVLEAGSAAALKKWMDLHGYQYPDGMDDVCEQYVDDRSCFVAVKTKVGEKSGVTPQPGQRAVQAKLPKGASFDGHVQAMGFRFRSDEFVVPMRLSAFNDGELRNIVYLLTDGPRRIRSIPEEYVVRQISGQQLFRNVTDPLPLRIIGGTPADLTEWHHTWLKTQRNPTPKNGASRELFASDLLAVESDGLALPHEEREKELLAIGERFGLRGAAIDKINSVALQADRDKTLGDALAPIKSMTLTVVDGDFPREVLAGQNLTFVDYRMPKRRNNARSYDAKNYGPGAAKQGILKLGALDPLRARTIMTAATPFGRWLPLVLSLATVGAIALARRRR